MTPALDEAITKVLWLWDNAWLKTSGAWVPEAASEAFEKLRRAKVEEDNLEWVRR